MNAPLCMECTCCRCCDRHLRKCSLGQLERLVWVELQADCASAVNPDGCYTRSPVLTVHDDLRSTIDFRNRKNSCRLSRSRSRNDHMKKVATVQRDSNRRAKKRSPPASSSPKRSARRLLWMWKLPVRPEDRTDILPPLHLRCKCVQGDIC